jgi:uncharacterized RmlC-like cupin family protein
VPRQDWSQLWTPGWESKKKVIKPSDTKWETTRDGRIRSILSQERADARTHSLDLYQQEIPAGGRSGKHWHMADEAIYVISGSGYSLQWDVEAEIEREIDEDWGPLVPISTYGASKLACEGLIAAYCHMFELTGRAFRFANVVGPRQTHGVGYDFIRRLQDDPAHLRILGDGTQKKSYIHVEDVLAAMRLADERVTKSYDMFNVATDDYITVREIADLAVQLCQEDAQGFLLVLGFDGAADVDGGEQGEDEGLDRDDDRDLEDIDSRGHGYRDHGDGIGLEDEDQADHHEDEHVAREHVGEESHGERDQAHELRDDLERDD